MNGMFTAAEIFEIEKLRSNPFNGLPCMTSKVAVYVPTKIGDMPATEAVINYQREKVSETLARWFGGFTEVEANGGWYSEDKGRLIREKVYVIYAFAEKAVLEKCKKSLVELAAGIARTMEQEAVSIEVDGMMYLVPNSR